MTHIDIQYKNIVKDIIENGHIHKNRTGIDTLSVFGTSVRLNLQEGFPILTTKKVFYRQAFHETLWMFIQGSSDCKYLKDNNTTIWDEWICYDNDHPNGTIGNLYGPVLRAYRVNREDPNNTIDQLQRCIDLIKSNPNSRRIVMTAFDPRFVADEQLSFEDNVKAGNGVLNPCHSNFIQFKVIDGKLSGYFLTRSNDLFLGAPFNYIGAALLVHMVAHVCELDVGEIIYNAADTHIYVNHLDALKEQITRDPYPLPKLIIKRKVTDINDFKFEDFELQNYNSHPALKADVAI